MSNLRVMSLIYDFTVYGVIIIVEGFVPIPESKAVIYNYTVSWESVRFTPTSLLPVMIIIKWE